MAYIGKTPVLGNFVKLDAITVVNGQAAYTMQNGGVNFTDYTTVNQFLVSLNGTIQAATDSFTVSSSTITFASNLSTGDVIDFIIVFGNSLSAGTVSDSAITTAKLADSSVSLAKLTATGTKDATTFLRGDNTFASAGGTNTPAFEAYLSSAQVIANTTVTKININTERFDTANAYDNSSNYRFTPQTAGKYFVYAHLNLQTNGKKIANAIPSIHKNGSNYTQSASNFANNTTSTIAIGISNVITMNGSSDYLEVHAYIEVYDGAEARITPELAGSYFGAYRIIE